MNILVLTSNNKVVDGWSAVGCNIVKNLKECNAIIFSSEEMKKLGFGFNRLKSQMFDRFKYISIVHDVLNVLIKNREKVDIVYCNVEYYAPVAMILSKIYKIPYVVVAHGTYGVLLPHEYTIYKKAFEKANKVITVSNFTKNRMQQEGIEANYEVILNGVDKSIFKPDDSIRKENIITFVGNLKPRKGLEFLLDSMRDVNKTNPNIKLLIIGNIDFKSQKYIDTLDYINRYKLNVEFVGKVDEKELIAYYQRAKLNILPSKTAPYYFEGFGLIHLEANGCNTLTIGTKDNGNEDAITEGNGYLIEYGDTNVLSSLILDIFSKDSIDVDVDKLTDWKEVSSKYLKAFKEWTSPSLVDTA